MENWMMLALSGSVLVGLYWFITKIQSERKWLTNNGFIWYLYLYLSFFSFVLLFLRGETFVYDYKTLIYAAILITVNTLFLQYRFKALKHLSSATYFINFRVISSILLLFIGMLFFSETITVKEQFWIFIWFFTFYLLLEKKEKWQKQKYLKKWILYLFYSIIFTSLVQVMGKYFIINSDHLSSLLFFEWLFWVVGLIMMNGYKKIKEDFRVKDLNNHMFLLLAGIIYTWAIYCNMLAFKEWDLAIVYKIISYSLFIPIILSVIFYKEKVTPKKILAFILTVISIWFFM